MEMLNPTVYERLRRSARTMLRKRYRNPQWEPAELVHEALLRIARSQAPIEFHDSGHLHAIVLLTMRRILIDSARAARWNESRTRETDPDTTPAPMEDPNAMPVRDALNRLAAREKRISLIVEMRFYWGLDLQEIATELCISTRTVKRELVTARTWLRNVLATRMANA
jgi:RNA polymerase sigma-70 factor, ECF subfamily